MGYLRLAARAGETAGVGMDGGCGGGGAHVEGRGLWRWRVAWQVVVAVVVAARKAKARRKVARIPTCGC